MTSKIGRNDPCPCGSGKKYKQCCQQRHAAAPAKADPAQIAAAIRTALHYQRMGHTTQAEMIGRQVLQVAPSNREALHLLGTIALQSGRIEEAITLLLRAIRYQPANPEYLSNLGFAYHEQGALDMAQANYRKALALKPDHANALYNLHALLLYTPEQAMTCLRAIIKSNPGDWETHYMLGVLLDYTGQPELAAEHFHTTENSGKLGQARLDAWRYLKSTQKNLPRITGSMYETFQLALNAAPKQGLVLEFGVRFGNSIRQIAALARQQVHGFDSFEGLPEDWHNEAKGSYTTQGNLPKVPQNVTLHVGWFEATLPDFLARHPGPVRLINIDCDIYSSTKTVLEQLAPRMIDGSIIIFDEYIGNEHWREDEFKAFQEAVALHGWQYEYLSFSIFTKQVAVKIKIN